MTIEPLDPSSLDIARRVHAVQMAAYAQEARLIAAIDFVPLRRTLAEVQASLVYGLGAFEGAELVGAAALEREGATCMGIASLVVEPSWQRRGVARGLMQAIIELHGTGDIEVQTAARNEPALSLYRAFGFVDMRRWFIGAERLELVRLSRRPVP